VRILVFDSATCGMGPGTLARVCSMMTSVELNDLFTPIFLEAFTNLASMPADSRPRHLAHYTSISVLEKIVQNNEIWFSHPLFMNDHEEMLFGIREGVRILREASGSTFSDMAGGDDNFNKLRQQYTEFIRRFEAEVSKDVYVFCLSEYDDVKQPHGRLSMWRGYGANGNGVALVFNTSFLTPDEGSPLLICKVRYGSAEERADWIKESFNKCLSLLHTCDIHSQHIWATAWYMFRLTLYHSLSSKHPGFDEEHEWRIVYFGDLDSHNLLRDRRSYLIRGNTIEPKLKFPIEPLKLEPAQGWSFDNVLDRIVLGPTHTSSLALFSVERMLECLGKPEFAKKLRVSQIPYRPMG
jgi:Protein of unknown function (DUF2971)